MELLADPSKIDIERDLPKIRIFDIEGVSNLLTDPFTFHSGILIGDNNKVVGAGLLRVINEVKIVLDPTLSNFNKAKGVKLLLDAGLPMAQCPEVVATITQGGWEYIRMLIQHYNFQIDPGRLLRR